MTSNQSLQSIAFSASTKVSSVLNQGRIYVKMRGYSVTAVRRPLNLTKSRFLAFTEERGRVMAHPCNLDTIDGNLRWYLWQPR